ncbi:hypothetical protein [Prosthecobacter fusiformis]|nr:hypothetical protein [Prosthecobacter fusiformis]
MSYAAKLIKESGYRAIIAPREITDAVNFISHPDSIICIRDWVLAEGITRLGLSYRLDPTQASEYFGKLLYLLESQKLRVEHGGPLRGVYFAGLPPACDLITSKYGKQFPVFCGDESPAESLEKMGVPQHRIPASLAKNSAYDNLRLNFGHELIADGAYLKIKAEDRSGYPGYGTSTDHVVNRLDHMLARRQSPLLRVHVGPYCPNRMEAIEQFIIWLGQLSKAGLLDTVSIGTSQLTQERFGENWEDAPNGGGVPVNSEAEYRRIREAASPMLVRTYAGTTNIPKLATIHERSLNIAWHAMSFWWFSQMDGRGPHTVYHNLGEHLETLRVIAPTNKPFEPNIPHHFAFRGGDDVTYVLSAYLAAKTAKRLGVRYFILQNMLNTPKYTWGIQDLAKARSMLTLVRELEDDTFRVILQPRAGLDYFSPDLQKAKAQLAAVSALMDDIEPEDTSSPPMIHVVSYSEASHLADPDVINESLQITRAALTDYRLLRARGKVPHMGQNRDLTDRTTHLLEEVRVMIAAIEKAIPEPYTQQGLYRIFAAGFLAAPYLWECREEFRHATSWNTDIIDGGIAIVDAAGKPISAKIRSEIATTQLSDIKIPL